jgi:hypothetical protein
VRRQQQHKVQHEPPKISRAIGGMHINHHDGLEAMAVKDEGTPKNMLGLGGITNKSMRGSQTANWAGYRGRILTRLFRCRSFFLERWMAAARRHRRKSRCRSAQGRATVRSLSWPETGRI